MGIHLGRVGHIGIHVTDMDRSIDFYRKTLGLKVTGRWGPPDFGCPICFMRINDKHHDVVLFGLSEEIKKSRRRASRLPGSYPPGSRPYRFRGRFKGRLAPGA